MDLLVEKKKNKLVSYITTLENEIQINHLFEFVSESEINEKPFDFESEWNKGKTIEESKAETIKRINAWWGK
jgi:hypothetical protein